jgi:hypothetical protein
MNVIIITLYCMTNEAVYVQTWQENDHAFWTIITGKKTTVGIISVTIGEK